MPGSPTHRRRAAIAAAVFAGLALVGCGTPNPTFPISTGDARAELRSMRADPARLERPLVIVGGFADPGFATLELSSALAGRLNNDRVLALSMHDEDDFDAMRARLIDAARDRFGDDEGRLPEVDAIGNSMGGLALAHAAGHGVGDDHLPIRRLFTIATPWRGAEQARNFALSPAASDMKPGSEFIAHVNRDVAAQGVEVVPYTRLGDGVVGSHNTAPFGFEPRWLPTPFGEPSHLMAFYDPRIQADILRRLRGEPGYTTDPPAPLPATDTPTPELTSPHGPRRRASTARGA